MYGLLSLTLLAFLCSSIAYADSPTPPEAKRVPHELTTNGDTRIDDYYWLRDDSRENPDVIGYLEAENAYCDAMLKHTEGLQKRIYDEIVGRIKEDDESAPYRYGDYWYYSREEEGKQYKIYCRKHGSLDADEEILLDVNAAAEGQEYYRLGSFSVSPDHKRLAFTADLTGREKYKLMVKDLESGELLGDVIDDTAGDLVWAGDNATLFYTTFDETLRPYRVHRHKVGDDPKNDVVVFEEPDERFYVGLSRTRSEKFVFISCGSKVTDETLYIPADQPWAAFKPLLPRKQGVEYRVSHQGDRFLIVTNLDATNFRLMQTPVKKPGWDHLTELIPHRDDVLIESASPFADFFVLTKRENGLRQLEIHPSDGKVSKIKIDEPVFSSFLGTNRNYETDEIRFVYESLITPESTYDYDVHTGARKLLKREPVLGGYDPANYTQERIYATADDGTQIPISLVYRKGALKRDGSTPTLLYGYGSYGATIDPYFSYTRPSLLDRGMLFALAQVRGGGAMGRTWYLDGKFLKKKNTFTDFIAAGEHLVNQKYTNPDKLAIMGGSAGGLLMGATINMRPDLFNCCVAQVPFVDVLTTMLDESIPLTVTEFEEWGNPAEPEFYEYMKSYSPYDNVAATEYPNLLITAGLNDPRVQYWEPAKWCAKLRYTTTGDHWILMHTNMGAGHGGASGRYDRYKEIALEFAFILDRLGIANAPAKPSMSSAAAAQSGT